MMFPTNIEQFFKMQSPITPIGTIAPWKYALGGAIAGGAAAVAYLGGKGIQQAQTQTGKAQTDATYTISPSREGVVNLYYPSAATVQQAQEQKATAQTTDYLQWILVGGIAIAALYVLTRRKK